MNREHDFISALEDYLEEFDGATPLPDETRDAIRAELPSIRQLPAWWPGWRLPEMNNIVKLSVAAAAVVVAALVGFNYLVAPNVGDTGIGLGDATATPTSEPVMLPDGPLEPGTYVTSPYRPPNDSIRFTLDVPDGWHADGGDLFLATGTEGPGGAAILFSTVTGLFSEPCSADYGGAGPDVTVGPSVDDLANAFAEQTAYETTMPTDVTLDGYSGKRIDLQLPSDIEYADPSCSFGGYFIWDGSIFAQGPDNRWHLWILDVDGTRVVILAQDFPTTAADDQAELIAIVESIQIDTE